MIGRAVHERPWNVLSSVDTTIFGEDQNPSENRRQVQKRAFSLSRMKGFRC